MYHWKQNTYLQLVHGPFTLTITPAACFTSQLAVTIYKVLYVRTLCFICTHVVFYMYACCVPPTHGIL